MVALAMARSKNSIVRDGGRFQLENDLAAPGSNKVYGTNGSGVRGWYDAGGVSVPGSLNTLLRSDGAGSLVSTGVTIDDQNDFSTFGDITAGGTLQAPVLYLPSAASPAIVTDRLYSFAGKLRYNGQDLGNPSTGNANTIAVSDGSGGLAASNVTTVGNAIGNITSMSAASGSPGSSLAINGGAGVGFGQSGGNVNISPGAGGGFGGAAGQINLIGYTAVSTTLAANTLTANAFFGSNLATTEFDCDGSFAFIKGVSFDESIEVSTIDGGSLAQIVLSASSNGLIDFRTGSGGSTGTGIGTVTSRLTGIGYTVSDDGGYYFADDGFRANQNIANSGIRKTVDTGRVTIFADDQYAAGLGHGNPEIRLSVSGTDIAQATTSGFFLFGGFQVDGNSSLGGTHSPTSVLDVADDVFRIRISKTPANSSAAGSQGDIAWDANYLYVCVLTNTWKRVALSSF